jgi:predicted AlkP superfamily phosphohydrolase/phosphomutase
MGPNYSGSHILKPLLERMKLANAGGSDAGASPPKPKRSLSSALRGLVPKEFRALVSKHLLPRAVNEKLSMHWKTADVQWSRTRAFVIENANEGYIRVNLKGREPQGIVEGGEEFDAICSALVATTSRMTNPANGRPAASHVHKVADLYSGPCAGNFPDVIIGWDPDARVTTELATHDHGVVASDQPGYAVTPYYTGNHRGNAFVVAQGPSIAAGAVVQGASILDLAPTILSGFGVPAPSHMDGRVVDSLK